MTHVCICPSESRVHVPPCPYSRINQSYHDAKRWLIDSGGMVEALKPAEIRAVRKLLARELDADSAAGKKG